jgi:hypothetical protein
VISCLLTFLLQNGNRFHFRNYVGQLTFRIFKRWPVDGVQKLSSSKFSKTVHHTENVVWQKCVCRPNYSNFFVMNWSTCAVTIQNQLKYCMCEILCWIPWAGDPPITKHRVRSYVFFSYHGRDALVGSDLIFRNGILCVELLRRDPSLYSGTSYCVRSRPVTIPLDIWQYSLDSVGIAPRYGLDGPWIESWWGGDFSHPSRPALGPTRVFLGGKAAGAWRWLPTRTERRG